MVTYVNKVFPKSGDGQTYVNRFNPGLQPWFKPYGNGFFWPTYRGVPWTSYCGTGWCWPYPTCNGGGWGCGTTCRAGGTFVDNSGITTADGTDASFAQDGVDDAAVSQVAASDPISTGIDLELADLELIDAGNPAANQGPAYRVTVRNIGDVPAAAFDVALVATNGEDPNAKAPAAARRLSKLDPGQTLQVDVRLPAKASQSTTLFVGVDPRGEIQEITKENNVARVARTDIAVPEQLSAK